MSDEITKEEFAAREGLSLTGAFRDTDDVQPSQQVHPSMQNILRGFEYDHLPSDLKALSQACANLAYVMVDELPQGAELSVGLRKLLEAKDCFVRAAVYSRR